jgi:hypothetical protein
MREWIVFIFGLLTGAAGTFVLNITFRARSAKHRTEVRQIENKVGGDLAGRDIKKN